LEAEIYKLARTTSEDDHGKNEQSKQGVPEDLLMKPHLTHRSLIVFEKEGVPIDENMLLLKQARSGSGMLFVVCSIVFVKFDCV
jgi:hypothetical protein